MKYGVMVRGDGRCLNLKRQRWEKFRKSNWKYYAFEVDMLQKMQTQVYVTRKRRPNIADDVVAA